MKKTRQETFNDYKGVGARQQWSSLTRRRLLICFEEPVYRRLHIGPHLVQALLPLIPSCSLNAPPAPIVLRQGSFNVPLVLLYYAHEVG